MYALTWYHDEERSHDGVSLIAVSDDPRLLEERAAEIETEQLREGMPFEHDDIEPAELSWADWGAPGQTESVAVVAWGRYAITEVDRLGA